LNLKRNQFADRVVVQADRYDAQDRAQAAVVGKEVHSLGSDFGTYRDVVPAQRLSETAFDQSMLLKIKQIRDDFFLVVIGDVIRKNSALSLRVAESDFRKQFTLKIAVKFHGGSFA
jgi:hypothetical protein